jgi:hypothetical protein
MKKLVIWFYLMSKRLYRKPVFLAILVLIPVLVLGYSTVNTEESGVVTVALAQEGQDPLASRMIEFLRSDSTLIRYVVCEDPESALTKVQTGKADAAWIFPEQMEQKVAAFVENPVKSNAFVKVTEREDTVALMLTREKLSGALFSCCSETLYLRYIRQNIPQMEHLSDEELLEYYRNTGLSEELFSYSDVGENMIKTENTHYLLAPLRGLLAVVIVLCGMAAAMYYMQDVQKGTFGWVPESRRPLTELGCQLVAVGQIALAALLSLLLAGMAAPVWQELLVLVLHCLCTVSFCMVLRRLCGSIKVLGAMIPLVLVAMLLICPVFLDLGFLRQVQLLFPPTYYINAVYNAKYLWYMPVYIVCTGTLYLLLGFLPGRKADR